MIVSDINLFVDYTETQAVSNDKRVHRIIFRQIIIRFFELIYLLGIQDMNLSVKWFVKEQQERVIYIDQNEGGFIEADLTEHMGDVAFERHRVMKDCANVLIRDFNRLRRPKRKIE